MPRDLDIPISPASHPALTGINEAQVAFRSPRFRQLRPRGGTVPDALPEAAAVSDDAPPENGTFSYRLLLPEGKGGGPRDALVLLHGLNERSWDKYLPWAATLARETGRAVLLFPLAFHMQRSPAAWSAPRPMAGLSRARRRAWPEVQETSFANAALSTRLHADPRRLVWSGVQSVLDLVHLARTVRSGRHPLLGPEARLDFFSYSIGTLVTQVLLMANPQGLFEDSRAFLFCGGCTLNDTDPVSRYILDSVAGHRLRSFFVSELEDSAARSRHLGRVLFSLSIGASFLAMLDRDRWSREREQGLAALAPRLRAVGLEKDRVFPAGAIQQTLAPAGVATETLDFPYAYDHVEPFPAQAPPSAVSEARAAVFSRAAAFLA